ncbi:MAG: hypothetical protein FMNOHCHN_01526 [Ignavibacteriaceae bacterium]|nr:hypothetical protein [Ignavibacteriaceae bacterium]
MRPIYSAFSHINLEKKLTGDSEWSKKIELNEILKSSPKIVNTYDELVIDVSEILNRNRKYVLFYRGQSKDYKTKEEKTSLLPSIYRKGSNSARLSLKKRFETLKKTSNEILALLNHHYGKQSDARLVRRYQEMVWSILQHYSICDTPLLDITHSLHVACSFALENPSADSGIIYVFGLPWQTDAIGYNSYDELVNIRLLSVCPPFAKRPFFQEGYLAGPFPNYNLDDTRRIPQFDFSRRLIAKFQIKNSEKFWGAGFNKIPREKLYPADDPIQDLLKKLKNK